MDLLSVSFYLSSLLTIFYLYLDTFLIIYVQHGRCVNIFTCTRIRHIPRTSFGRCPPSQIDCQNMFMIFQKQCQNFVTEILYWDMLYRYCLFKASNKSRRQFVSSSSKTKNIYNQLNLENNNKDKKNILKYCRTYYKLFTPKTNNN